MKNNRLLTLATFLFSIYTLSINGQTIKRDTIPYTTISKINSKNDSIIDTSYFPDWRNSNNLLVEQFSLKPTPNTSWHTQRIKDIIAEWKDSHDVKDEGETNYYYGIVKETNEDYSIQRLKGTINYSFGEIGGGYSIERVLFMQESGLNEILCLFDKSLVLDEKQIKLHFIRPTGPPKFPHQSFSRETPLEANTKYQFELNDNKYELTYSADLSLEGFEYDGYGTIYPTYYNIKLKLTNKTSNTEQVIFSNPYSSFYNISEIAFGDIDNDSKVDIICKINDETCIRRIVFLSSKAAPQKLLKYIGHTEISCWTP